jgi:hypothetical protein
MGVLARPFRRTRKSCEASDPYPSHTSQPSLILWEGLLRRASMTQPHPGVPFAGRHIAVLLGGPSSEREVSLATGAACADALERLGAKVSRIDPGPTSPRC